MSWKNRTLFVTGAAASIYTGVSALMAWGLMRSPRIRTEETPATVGLPYESIEFPSRIGEVALHGWLVPPPGCTDMNDAMNQRWVVLVHGYGANRTDPTAGLLGIARDIRDRNFGVLLFDLRSSGESAGERGSAGFYERFDLHGALDYLADRGADRSRMGVLGHSMGGAIALMACSTPDTAAAVVADSSFADLWLMIKRAQRGAGLPLRLANPGMSALARVLFGVDIGGISPARSLAMSESPVLIIHGEDDDIVPADHARLLAKAAGTDFVELENATDRLWIVPGAGHLEAYRVAKDEYIDRVASFFDQHLAAGVHSSSAGRN